MVWGIVYVILFSFINEMFDFSIDNVVWKSIINECLSYIFKFIKEDNSRGFISRSSVEEEELFESARDNFGKFIKKIPT